MVYLEVFVELYALNKVLVANTPHDGYDIDSLPTVLDFKVVADEGVILVPYGHHLLVWGDVEAQGLPVVVF